MGTRMPSRPCGTEWYLYMVRCRGGPLYTGIACDVQRRLSQHRAGKGARYLRGRGPLELVFQAYVGSRSRALRLERAVKCLPKRRKEALAASGCGLEMVLGANRQTGRGRKSCSGVSCDGL